MLLSDKSIEYFNNFFKDASFLANDFDLFIVDFDLSVPVGDKFFFAGLGVGLGVGQGSLFGGDLGVACRLCPFWGWIGGSGFGEGVFDRALSFLVFCPGRLPRLVLGPWTDFGGPEYGLRARLKTSPMLCNYIKFKIVNNQTGDSVTTQKLGY